MKSNPVLGTSSEILFWMERRRRCRLFRCCCCRWCCCRCCCWCRCCRCCRCCPVREKLWRKSFNFPSCKTFKNLFSKNAQNCSWADLWNCFFACNVELGYTCKSQTQKPPLRECSLWLWPGMVESLDTSIRQSCEGGGSVAEWSKALNLRMKMN